MLQFDFHNGFVVQQETRNMIAGIEPLNKKGGFLSRLFYKVL